MLTAPSVNYEADPSHAFPLIASGCFCPFFFSPSYQLSRKKHFSWTLATDMKEFHIVSSQSVPSWSTSPIWGQQSDVLCPLISTQPHWWFASLSKPPPNEQDGTCPGHFPDKTLHDAPCSMYFAVFCVLGKTEQLSKVSKDYKAETNSEKPSSSTAVFVLQMNSPKLDLTKIPAIKLPLFS